MLQWFCLGNEGCPHPPRPLPAPQFFVPVFICSLFAGCCGCKERHAFQKRNTKERREGGKESSLFLAPLSQRTP